MPFPNPGFDFNMKTDHTLHVGAPTLAVAKKAIGAVDGFGQSMKSTGEAVRAGFIAIGQGASDLAQGATNFGGSIEASSNTAANALTSTSRQAGQSVGLLSSTALILGDQSSQTLVYGTNALTNQSRQWQHVVNGVSAGAGQWVQTLVHGLGSAVSHLTGALHSSGHSIGREFGTTVRAGTKDVTYALNGSSENIKGGMKDFGIGSAGILQDSVSTASASVDKASSRLVDSSQHVASGLKGIGIDGALVLQDTARETMVGAHAIAGDAFRALDGSLERSEKMVKIGARALVESTGNIRGISQDAIRALDGSLEKAERIASSSASAMLKSIETASSAVAGFRQPATTGANAIDKGVEGAIRAVNDVKILARESVDKLQATVEGFGDKAQEASMSWLQFAYALLAVLVLAILPAEIRATIIVALALFAYTMLQDEYNVKLHARLDTRFCQPALAAARWTLELIRARAHATFVSIPAAVPVAEEQCRVQQPVAVPAPSLPAASAPSHQASAASAMSPISTAPAVSAAAPSASPASAAAVPVFSPSAAVAAPPAASAAPILPPPIVAALASSAAAPPTSVAPAVAPSIAEDPFAAAAAALVHLSSSPLPPPQAAAASSSSSTSTPPQVGSSASSSSADSASSSSVAPPPVAVVPPPLSFAASLCATLVACESIALHASSLDGLERKLISEQADLLMSAEWQQLRLSWNIGFSRCNKVAQSALQHRFFGDMLDDGFKQAQKKEQRAMRPQQQQQTSARVNTTSSSHKGFSMFGL